MLHKIARPTPMPLPTQKGYSHTWGQVVAILANPISKLNKHDCDRKNVHDMLATVSNCKVTTEIPGHYITIPLTSKRHLSNSKFIHTVIKLEFLAYSNSTFVIKPLFPLQCHQHISPRLKNLFDSKFAKFPHAIWSR